MKIKDITPERPVIAWWSGGIASAVTCHLCLENFGILNVRVVFIDTGNEDEDTYRFMKECEVWYGNKIQVIRNGDYNSIQSVWYDAVSLNVATGAKCSQMLKRIPRERFELENDFSYQAFGFDIEEINRARGMLSNNPNSRPIFPLITALLSKKECVKIIQQANNLFHPIQVPRTYKMGYLNNNCFKTGCVQGGIGYWQKILREDSAKFDRMAQVEHYLTDKKGEPVTMLKDQSKGGGLVFLKPHPAYPAMKDISMMKGREPLPLFECNGFCGTNDLIPRIETEKEINYAEE